MKKRMIKNKLSEMKFTIILKKEMLYDKGKKN